MSEQFTIEDAISTTVRTMVERAGADRSEAGASSGDMTDGSGDMPKAGFAAVRDDLDRRSRQWIAASRLLELQQQQLAAVESERDRALAALTEITPLLQQHSEAVGGAMAAYKQGRGDGKLDSLFEGNEEVLERLERIAISLNMHFLSCRSAWTQYVQAVESARRLGNDDGR